jgi:hypothetical protein
VKAKAELASRETVEARLVKPGRHWGAEAKLGREQKVAARWGRYQEAAARLGRRWEAAGAQVVEEMALVRSLVEERMESARSPAEAEMALARSQAEVVTVSLAAVPLEVAVGEGTA